MHHRRRIGEARGFDHQGVELVAVFEELKQAAQEIAAHGATDAAVAHLDDFLVGRDQQMMIDADCAEFIDDDRDAPAMIGGQDAIEKCGFAGAQKPGEDGYRHAWIVAVGHK